MVGVGGGEMVIGGGEGHGEGRGGRKGGGRGLWEKSAVV